MENAARAIKTALAIFSLVKAFAKFSFVKIGFLSEFFGFAIFKPTPYFASASISEIPPSSSQIFCPSSLIMNSMNSFATSERSS